MRICICGGGNVSHAMAGHLAAAGHRPNILTRRPQEWGRELVTLHPDGQTTGALGTISTAPAIVAESQLIIISVPQFALKQVVHDMLPHLHEGQRVILTPGTAEATKYLSPIQSTGAEVLILQRVPFISRTEHYGHSVRLLGGRSSNGLYTPHTKSHTTCAPMVEALFGARVFRVESPLSFLLSPSNPILHPARLLDLFGDYHPGIVYDHHFFFYREWNDRASELYLAADDELQAICQASGDEAAQRDFIPGRTYYESANAAALTAKIRSIPAFANILTPMRQAPGGWVPDFASRYFTEDIPYGTQPIVDLAEKLGVHAPTLRAFVDFGQQMACYNHQQQSAS